MFGIGKKNKPHMDCKRLLNYENNCKEEMAINVYLMLDYLFHIMQLEFPKLMGGKKYQTVITVFDETSGEYYAKDYLFKPAEVTASADKFYLSMPNGLTEGTWDDMHLYIDERPPAFFVTFDLFAIMR